MRQPIVKDLRSKTKAKDLTSKAKDFMKCPRGQGHGLEEFITGIYSELLLHHMLYSELLLHHLIHLEQCYIT